MFQEAETAMKVLIERAKKAVGSEEALRFSQAVLNLAHAQSINNNTKTKDGK